MDPDAALNIMIDRAEAILASADAGGEVDDDDALELAEATLALTDWIRKGGFLPSAWTDGRAPSAENVDGE
jgi:hypothetical protein